MTRRERGTVLVELALSLSFLALLALGTMDIVWMEKQSSALQWSLETTLTARHDVSDLNVCAYAGATAQGQGLANIGCTFDGTTLTLTYQTSGLVAFLPQATLMASGQVAQ